MPNTYTGWPVIPSGDARLTVIEPVPGRRFTVLAGPVATVLDWLIRRFHAEVEPIDQGILDDYGYNYRKVRGSDSWSNHASGTAVDLNATKHPFKTRADQNFSPAQIAAVRQILADATINGQQVVRWLDANDPMHFEINYVSRGGTPENVAKLAARLAEPLKRLLPSLHASHSPPSRRVPNPQRRPPQDSPCPPAATSAPSPGRVAACRDTSPTARTCAAGRRAWLSVAGGSPLMACTAPTPSGSPQASSVRRASVWTVSSAPTRGQPPGPPPSPTPKEAS